MRKRQQYFKNALIMSSTSLLLRAMGIFFQAYLVGRIGSSGVGLYQLVLSVYVLGITFASSGIGLATTRLVSEEMGKTNLAGAKAALRKCLAYGISFGLAASVLLFLNASHLAAWWLGDVRVTNPLRILSFALPFISMSSVFTGYFIAVRRVSKNSIAQICENIIRISATILMLQAFSHTDLEGSCMIIAGASALSEFCCFLILFGFYWRDQHRSAISPLVPASLTKRMFSISLPVAFNSYVRTGLSSATQLMVPSGLRKYGLSESESLSQYGTIHAMVFPILYYPHAILSSFASLLLPELSEDYVNHNMASIDRILDKVFHATFLFAVGACGVFLCFSEYFGMGIYQSSNATNYLRLLSPLVLLIYLDCVVDNILIALNQQVHSMFVNFIESGINIILIYLLLPVYGVVGYLFILFFGKAVNMLLSIAKLIHVTNLRIRFFQWLFCPALCIGCAVLPVKLLLSVWHTEYSILLLLPALTLCILLYILFLRLIDCIPSVGYNSLTQRNNFIFVHNQNMV